MRILIYMTMTKNVISEHILLYMNVAKSMVSVHILLRMNVAKSVQMMIQPTTKAHKFLPHSYI